MASASKIQTTATVALLDRWKAARGIGSDYAAAQALGIARSTVSAWRAGRNHAQPCVADRMAQECKLDGLAVLAAIEADRATGENGRCWARYGRGAFMVLAAGIALAQPVQAHTGQDIGSHYAKRRKPARGPYGQIHAGRRIRRRRAAPLRERCG